MLNKLSELCIKPELYAPGSGAFWDDPHKMRLPESHSWYFSESEGFFSDKPHLCLNSVYQYIDDRVELRQSIVVTDEDVQCYNIWDCFYNKDELINEVMPVGFSSYELFGDIAGKEYSDTGETICAVLTK